MNPNAQHLAELMYQALTLKVGLAVSCEDPRSAVQLFHQARAKAADPVLMGLRVMVSPREPERELWLVKNVKELTIRPARVSKVDDEIVRALGLDDIPDSED